MRKIQPNRRGVGKTTGEKPRPRLNPIFPRSRPALPLLARIRIFWTEPRGVLSTAEGPRIFQLQHPRSPQPRGDGGLRQIIGENALREQTCFRRHATAVAHDARALNTSSRGGEVQLFSFHKHGILAFLGLDKQSLVVFCIVVDPEFGLISVGRNALALRACLKHMVAPSPTTYVTFCRCNPFWSF